MGKLRPGQQCREMFGPTTLPACRQTPTALALRDQPQQQLYSLVAEVIWLQHSVGSSFAIQI